MTLGYPVLGFPERHSARRSPTRTPPPPNSENYNCPMDHLLFGALAAEWRDPTLPVPMTALVSGPRAVCRASEHVGSLSIDPAAVNGNLVV